ncbi:transposase [Nocardia sp. CNY236]|uniref:transposase n=1 Tax=Nocardia sp. CNY236 TaxID=1169152 RepID=UPI0004182A84|nr:transposase [Nocardia sp. CNY236]
MGDPGAAAATIRDSGGKGGRREKWPRRLVCDAIFYLSRGGIAWAHMPHDFPPAKTV